MIERIMIVPDPHLTSEGCSHQYKLAKKFIKQYKPHETIILGDFMHCESISHWIENKKRLCENKRYAAELAVANNELDYIQQYSRRVTYLEGNHEVWVTDYIDKHPEQEGLMELTHRLHLMKRGVQWLKINKLYNIGKMYFVHGLYCNKHHALHHLTTLGCSICYGHTHTAQTAQMNMKMIEPIMAYGLGCLCDHEPEYMRGKPCNWINQFGIMDVDTKTGRFNLYPVNITDDQFILNGRAYK